MKGARPGKENGGMCLKAVREQPVGPETEGTEQRNRFGCYSII